jgi:dCTP deaminase
VITLATLSDGDILAALKTGAIKIAPFSEASLSPAGYDLRAGRTFTIPLRKVELLYTMERIELPADLSGQIFMRSSFAREGLVGSFALVDPGFRGQLTLTFLNMGKADVAIAEGERIAQLVLTRLESPAKKPYSGRYQDSKGSVGSKRNFSSNM